MRRWFYPLLAALFVMSLALPVGAAGAGGDQLVRVWVRSASPADAAALQAQYGLRHDFGALGFTMDMPGAALQGLMARPGLRAELVPQRQVLAGPPAERRKGGGGGRVATPADQTPWGIETVMNDPAISTTSGGAGINVAILDTGVARHIDLAEPGQCVDFSSNRSPVIVGKCDDVNGHGTHVAGTIAANGGGDGLGIFGVAPQVTYFAYKVCGPSGFCFADDVARAIQYAADNGAHIISMSLGGATTSDLERTAVEYAAGQGVLIIAAAGNSGPGPDTISYPGAFPQVVAVAALELVSATSTDRSPANLQVTSFSGRGMDDGNDSSIVEREVEVAAPGRNVESTWRDGTYRLLSGTSMATPHVSGLAARYWAAHPNAGPAQVRAWLVQQAGDYDVTQAPDGGAEAGFDTAAGYGSVRFDAP